MNYFSIVFKRFNKSCVNFWVVLRKRQFLGNFEKCFKYLEKIVQKIAKTALI